MYTVLIMDVEGWFAQFRVHSTITTQLTHVIPPKSTVIGLLLAKTGFARLDYSNWPTNTYQELINKIKVGIALNNKTINKFIDYNLYVLGRTRKPTQAEYIVDPKYTFVYIIPDDLIILNKYKLNNLLHEKEEVFKTYLGINECPMTIISTKIYHGQEITTEEKDNITTRFVLPEDIVFSIEPSKTGKKRQMIQQVILPITPPPISKEVPKKKDLGNKNIIDEKNNYRSFLVPIGESVMFRLNGIQKVNRLSLNGPEEELVVL